jgi:hypothetical protein
MRNTIAALFFIFASVWVFAAQSNMTTTHEITAGLRPVCFPGDPCGPQPMKLSRNVLLGPVCYPGDPCGPQPGQGMADIVFLLGPVCYPGDPCGPHPMRVYPISSLFGDYLERCLYSIERRQFCLVHKVEFSA